MPKQGPRQDLEIKLSLLEPESFLFMKQGLKKKKKASTFQPKAIAGMFLTAECCERKGEVICEK